VRPITEDEYHDVEATRNSAEAEEAIKLTVAPPKPKDGAQTPAPAPKAAKPIEKIAAEEVEEPTKAVSKKPTPPADEAPKLADLVDGWDD
jgi:hypothetical protein